MRPLRTPVLPPPSVDTAATHDFRHCAPPEPLVRTMNLATSLGPGECLIVLTPCWPEPLFSSLRQAGLPWIADTESDGAARIVIWRMPDEHGCAFD